mmetsp:Transcript_22872/g.39079  ORF Transcript_22872/g.39079 Transcript_22872/m.39079 type:complete len:213 (-) Transcript_22872:148-786(-)
MPHSASRVARIRSRGHTEWYMAMAGLCSKAGALYRPAHTRRVPAHWTSAAAEARRMAVLLPVPALSIAYASRSASTARNESMPTTFTSNSTVPTSIAETLRPHTISPASRPHTRSDGFAPLVPTAQPGLAVGSACSAWGVPLDPARPAPVQPHATASTPRARSTHAAASESVALRSEGRSSCTCRTLWPPLPSRSQSTLRYGCGRARDQTAS